MTYTWRESLDTQICRARRHHIAELMRWQQHVAGKADALAHEEAIAIVDHFVADLRELMAGYFSAQNHRKAG